MSADFSCLDLTPAGVKATLHPRPDYTPNVLFMAGQSVVLLYFLSFLRCKSKTVLQASGLLHNLSFLRGARNGFTSRS